MFQVRCQPERDRSEGGPGRWQGPQGWGLQLWHRLHLRAHQGPGHTQERLGANWPTRSPNRQNLEAQREVVNPKLSCHNLQLIFNFFRHYGGLTGLNKAETAAKHGEEQVKIWRTSFDIPPPPMEKGHEYYDSIVNDPRFDWKHSARQNSLLRIHCLGTKMAPRVTSFQCSSLWSWRSTELFRFGATPSFHRSKPARKF